MTTETDGFPADTECPANVPRLSRRKPCKARRPRDASKARRYRARRKEGCRIWKPELHIVNTEQLLTSLGYLDPMTEPTKKEGPSRSPNLLIG